jgi:DNA-binding response OmpR family regulator
MATLKVRPGTFIRKRRLPLTDISVLIVEDEPLIALDLHAALSGAGASIIAATKSAEALALIRIAEIMVAVLDVNLDNQDCSAICHALYRRKIPFAFHTGHPGAVLVKEWPMAPVLVKPAQASAIVACITSLVGRLG